MQTDSNGQGARERKIVRFLRGLFGVILALGAYFVYIFIVIFVDIPMKDKDTSLVILISAPIAFGLIFLFMMIITKGDFSEEAGFTRISLFGVLKAALIGASLNMVTAALIVLIHFPEMWVEQNTESVSSVQDGNLVIVLLATGLMGPLIEELIFRGIMFDRVKRGWGIVLATILSALLFGLVHGNPLQGLYAAVCGLVLALVYNFTFSFWCAVIAHGAYNLGNYAAGTIKKHTGTSGLLIIGSVLFLAAFAWLMVPAIVDHVRKKRTAREASDVQDDIGED